jgi:hypothetical protein
MVFWVRMPCTLTQMKMKRAHCSKTVGSNPEPARLYYAEHCHIRELWTHTHTQWKLHNDLGGWLYHLCHTEVRHPCLNTFVSQCKMTWCIFLEGLRFNTTTVIISSLSVSQHVLLQSYYCITVLNFL